MALILTMIFFYPVGVEATRQQKPRSFYRTGALFLLANSIVEVSKLKQMQRKNLLFTIFNRRVRR